MCETLLPPEIRDKLQRDAAAAGFNAKRIDAKNSRWEYLRKCLALGRQYRDVISSPNR